MISCKGSHDGRGGAAAEALAFTVERVSAEVNDPNTSIVYSRFTYPRAKENGKCTQIMSSLRRVFPSYH